MFDFDTDTGEIWLYDVIGPAWAGMIDAGSMLTALKEMGGRDITLRISSPGGSVFDAIDIYNAIKRYSGKSIAIVDSLAASAASFIMLATDETRASKNSTIMIHRAMTVTFGNSDDHQKSIEMLATADSNILDMYAEKTGKPKDEIEPALAAETWLTASEALEFGLVDAIGETSDVVARVPEGMFAKTPEYLQVAAQAGRRQTPIATNRRRAKNKLGNLTKGAPLLS